MEAIDPAAQQPLPLEAGVPTDEELAPCPNCGRTFVQSSLQRHVAVCAKNTASRRGKFDSSKQRILGTELEQYLPPPVKQRQRSRSVPAVPGGPRRSLIPQPPVHEKCEYCGRSFGDKAIDRHREWCRNQKSFKPQTTPPSPAYSRMQARTQYKAPLAKSLRSRTREKYSPGSTKETTNKTSAPTSIRSSVSHTPTKTTTKAAYDVFQSAERQMQELLGSPLPSRKSQPYVITQKADIEVNLDEKFIKSEELLNGHESGDDNDDEPDAAEEESSIEDALHEISHQDSFSSVEIFKDELDEPSKIFEDKNSSPDEERKIEEALRTIKREFKQEPQGDPLTEEDVLNHLKATLEGTLDSCPLTDSLNYLDAALSLFQLDDIPKRPSNAPRSKASTKRRQYSVASPLSLLKPDPDHGQQQCSECGTTFPMPTAKFCCLCGTKRSV
ncbi:Hypothetical predicted protein [Cloeon dipterum]|uniref:C2HC/C3H-type domain-containing protein n=1 Tax=Cloeon dipterum TaxID=197152 RepID=A0A8S1CH15_9INSE|nr:Hypothetical predicted protein [Cloeon dipterum]